MSSALIIAAAHNAREAVPLAGIHLVLLAAWLTFGAKKFPAPVTALMAGAIVVNGAGWSLGLLDTVPHFDSVAHFLCTAAATLPITLKLCRRARSFVWVTALGVGATGGILWELYECAVDRLAHAPGTMRLDDTLEDLAFGLLGALVGAAIARQLLAPDLPEPPQAGKSR